MIFTRKFKNKIIIPEALFFVPISRLSIPYVSYEIANQ